MAETVSLSASRAGQVKAISKSVKEAPLSLADQVSFTYQLQVMLASELSLVDGLHILATSGLPRISEMSKQLLLKISRGASFSEALASHSQAFDSIYICAVKCGEETGQLTEILNGLHRRLERKVELRNRLGHAFSYPLIVFSVCFLMLIGLVYGLLPGFTKTLTSFGTELPWPTKLLLSASDPRILVVILGIILSELLAVAVLWKQKSEVRDFFNRAKFQIPLVGSALEDLMMAEFTRSFALLLESGVPLLKAVQLQIGNTGSFWLDRSLKNIQNSLWEGESFESALESQEQLPSLLTQTMATAHEAAALPDMLRHLSHLLTERGQTRLDAAIAMTEPMVMAIMGSVVGFVIIAAFLPLIGLIQKL